MFKEQLSALREIITKQIIVSNKILGFMNKSLSLWIRIQFLLMWKSQITDTNR